MKTISKQKSKPGTNLYLNNIYVRNFCYLLIIIIPVFTLYDYYSYALRANGYLGFPLDDSWIHLTYGKNLKEYFSFTYNKNESATAGTTSPVYTFIVAAGFFLTNNEMMLSYAIGGLFFILACLYFFKLMNIEFGSVILLSVSATLIFIFDYSMNFISLSGMETTLFIFLILLGTYFYKKNRFVSLGITLGLLLWTRPDGVAFAAAVFIHYFYTRYFINSGKKSDMLSLKQFFFTILIFACISSLYFLMNYLLAGTILPNTYYAKIAYYIDTEKRINFLKNFVWLQFTWDHYAVLMAGFIFSIIYFLFDLIKRRNNQTSFYIIFIFLFLLIYVIKLPTINKFGRYQMPMIPFFIIVSLIGFKDFFSLTKFFFKNKFVVNFLTVTAFLTIIYLSFSGYGVFKTVFAEKCKFTYNRQIAVANWINKNTNKDDIIAVHDVGAIGFYCDRKLIDVAGLITPEFTKIQNEENFSEILTDYMKKHGVAYSVFFNENFNFKNQNPVFITPKGETRDVFEINKFDPLKSKILSGKALRLILASRSMTNGNQIVEDMNKVLEMEPGCAIAYYVKSYGYSFNKDTLEVKNNLEKAVECQPDFIPALIQLGTIDFQNNNLEEAKKYFLKVTEFEPNNEEALHGIKLIDDLKKSF